VQHPSGSGYWTKARASTSPVHWYATYFHSGGSGTAISGDPAMNKHKVKHRSGSVDANARSESSAHSPARVALQSLLSMDMEQRREEIARDLRRRRARYRDIEPHDLAEALGVPQPDLPCSGDWSFTTYAEIVSVEEYAKCCDPASEIVYIIQHKVSAERFQQLLELSEGLDATDSPSFQFLSKEERTLLELAIAEEELEGAQMNGTNTIAHYSLETTSGATLTFEACIEDDGTCIHLRTPYDERAKRFKDLTKCLTDCY
jgi:hypothetical protein